MSAVRLPSVILSTYEQPGWLERTLRGYARQMHREFEILVADDGSGPETASVIDRARRDAGLAIRHLWWEHRGFRKCGIANHAIVNAAGDYLIFSDGDCVPRDDFVGTHVRLARAGRFLSGGALRLPPQTSRRVTIEDVESGRIFRPGWLVRRGWRPGHRLPRLTRSRGLAILLDRVTPTRATFNG
ncbi:MAG: glycosyltransferase, partial [Gemmatimonadota bacterium]